MCVRNCPAMSIANDFASEWRCRMTLSRTEKGVTVESTGAEMK